MEHELAQVRIGWTRSIRTKFAAMALLMLVIVAGGFADQQHRADVVAEGARVEAMLADGVRLKYEASFLGHLIADPGFRAGRGRYRARLREVVSERAVRMDSLLNGNQAERIAPLRAPEVRILMTEDQKSWHAEYLPRIEVLLSRTLDRQLAAASEELNALSLEGSDIANRIMVTQQALSSSETRRYGAVRVLVIAIIALAAAYMVWLGFNLAGRIMRMTGTAEVVARGDLAAAAQTEGGDEVAVLGASLNAMTATLRGLVTTEKTRREGLVGIMAAVREGVENLATTSVEILAATTEQGTSAQAAAAAMAQTVATMDALTQNANEAAERAKAVAESTRRAEETGKTGRKAVEDMIAVMRSVREQSESIAQSILALAEQAQAIGEIAAAVNDIADQVNLLALNATIEASRAGEQGRGFAVVATEVRVLGDQAKKATVQVRQILDASQKNTNAAVIATEEGNKRVGEAVRIAVEAGETIRGLSEHIADASEAAVQIAAGEGQRTTGMTQVSLALKNIDLASRQNLIASRQTEKAIQDLAAGGGRLKTMLERSDN